MLPSRWNPFRELSTFHREIDDLFQRSFGPWRGEEGAVISPMVNAYVRGDQYCIEVEIPGVDKKDLDVSVEGDVLALRGERKMSRETKDEDYLLRESQYGSFLRRLTLPEGVNTESIQASYENGVLKVTMPIDQKAITGRKIEIQAPGEQKQVTEKREEAEQVH